MTIPTSGLSTEGSHFLRTSATSCVCPAALTRNVRLAAAGASFSTVLAAAVVVTGWPSIAVTRSPLNSRPSAGQPDSIPSINAPFPCCFGYPVRRWSTTDAASILL